MILYISPKGFSFLMPNYNLTGRGFLFLRHGESEANFNQLSSGGDTDPELTKMGGDQARRVTLCLKQNGLTPGLIFVSPLKRAIKTAQIVNESFGIETRVEPMLIERLLGDWNGQSTDITYRLIEAGKDPPNGESDEDFRNRILEVFLSLSNYYERWPLIVGSRGIARILLERSKYPSSLFQSNCALGLVSLCPSDEFKIEKFVHLNPPDDKMQLF